MLRIPRSDSMPHRTSANVAFPVIRSFEPGESSQVVLTSTNGSAELVSFPP